MSKCNKIKLNKKTIIILILIFAIIILGIFIYASQFNIFKILYNNNNSLAKQIYIFNKSNYKFNNDVSDFFSKKFEELIEKYKSDEISTQELENEINNYKEYVDYTEKVENEKKYKDELGKANEFFNNKEYEKALKIYVKLNNLEYKDLTEEIDKSKQGVKKETLKIVDELKKNKNYSKAIEKINNIKMYYSDDKELNNLLSELKKLEEKQKEEEKIKDLKSTIKVTKVWTSSPNSAGGVDLFINWKNLSNKVVKYAYFTVIPYNSVKDNVTCTIRKYSRFTAQDEGPYKQGQGLSGTYWRWENAWYNYTIKGVNLCEVEIEYMDGSSITIQDDYIKYIM